MAKLYSIQSSLNDLNAAIQNIEDEQQKADCESAVNDILAALAGIKDRLQKQSSILDELFDLTD